MRSLLIVTIFCFVLLSAQALQATDNAVSLHNYIQKDIVERFGVFKDSVKIFYVKQEADYSVLGELTSSKNRPMDLAGKLMEAMQATGYIDTIIPRSIRRKDVEDGSTVLFELNLVADMTKIPKNLDGTRQFQFELPAEYPDFTAEVKIQIKNPLGQHLIYKKVCQKGEKISLHLQSTGISSLLIDLNDQQHGTFELP
jgi:hypothetical protein